MTNRLPPRDTRDRIVAAAGEIFGERGFRGTTIRQITERAGVNIAAVNYHFRDKDELYAQVLRDAKGWTGNLPLNDKGSPEERLRTLVVDFVRALLHPNRPTWHSRVISQEMLNPTPTLGNLMVALTTPLFCELKKRVAAAVPEPLPEVEINLLTCSVLGQCLFHVSCSTVLAQCYPELVGPDRADMIAEHIASFSLAALRGLHPHPTAR